MCTLCKDKLKIYVKGFLYSLSFQGSIAITFKSLSVTRVMHPFRPSLRMEDMLEILYFYE